MSQRVNITVKRSGEEIDLNVSLATTPANIAAALGWERVDYMVVTNRNVTIEGNHALLGKIREGDVMIFEKEGSAGWRS